MQIFFSTKRRTNGNLFSSEGKTRRWNGFDWLFISQLLNFSYLKWSSLTTWFLDRPWGRKKGISLHERYNRPPMQE